MITTTSSPDRIALHGPAAAKERVAAYIELTKPRLATLIVTVSMLTFFLAEPGSIAWLDALLTFVATTLLAAGIFALNHYMERDADGLMFRTGRRPLPTGTLKPLEALIFGGTLTTAAIAIAFVWLNPIAGAVSVFTAVSYLLVYTPLKQRTAYHTALGALSGATPPLLGWAGASGTLPPDAWALFAILFFWQFPHFLSIDMMYRDDYARAGIKVLPVVDRSGRKVAFQVVAATLLLIGATTVPWITGLAGPVYGVSALVSGGVFLYFGIRAVTRGRIWARYLLRASVLYLPLVFAVLLIGL